MINAAQYMCWGPLNNIVNITNLTYKRQCCQFLLPTVNWDDAPGLPKRK